MKIGSTFTLPEAPALPGYLFLGWYTGVPEKNPDPSPFYIDKDDITGVDMNSGWGWTVTGENGLVADLPTVERAGYTFDGWYIVSGPQANQAGDGKLFCFRRWPGQHHAIGLSAVHRHQCPIGIRVRTGGEEHPDCFIFRPPEGDVSFRQEAAGATGRVGNGKK